MGEVNILKSSNQLFNDTGSTFSLSDNDLGALMDNNTKADVVLLEMGVDQELKVKADIGTRYQVSRLEYYLSSPIINGLTVSYSENDVEYTEIPAVINADDEYIQFDVPGSGYAQYFKVAHTSPDLSYADYSPTIFLISESTTDTLGSKHINSSVVNDVFYYDASQEDWLEDSSLSWFTEQSDTNIRGRRREFPEHVLFVCTDTSVDVIDIINLELWMRFNNSANSILGNGEPYRVFAINGCAYISMQDDSLVLVDFVNDTSIKFDTIGRYTGNRTIKNRHAAVTYSSANSTFYPDPIMTNTVTDIKGAETEFGEVVALATPSGVSVLVDRVANFNSTVGTLPCVSVDVSERGGVYWGCTDNVLGTDVGEVNYVTDFTKVIASGTMVTGFDFTRDGYYDDLDILSEAIQDISVV